MKILWMTVAKVIASDQVIVDARSAMVDLDEERAGMNMDRVESRQTQGGFSEAFRG